MKKIKLSEFLTEANKTYKIKDISEVSPVQREREDSKGNAFIAVSLCWETETTKTTVNDDGDDVESPVFVAVTLSKTANEKRIAEGKEFNLAFINANLNSMVEVNEDYPNQAKILGSNRVVDKKAGSAIAKALGWG